MDPTTEYLVLLFFHEIPNKAAAIVALVLFAIISVAVTAITIKTRCYYMLTVAITGYLEMGGYITRVIMLSRPSLNGLIAQQALLIIPPVLLAIVEYITVSRLIELAAKKNGSNTRSCFAKSVSWCFTGSDIFCLLLQATGGGMYANPDTMNMARALLLAGLGAQIGFFAIFCCIVLYVKRSDRFGYANNQHFKPVFICLYATIALMYIRNIFCVIEFALGYDSYLATHELFLYIFDFAPIYACFLCFTFMHYGFWMGHDAVAQHIKGLPSVKQQDECARPAGLELPKVHIAC